MKRYLSSNLVHKISSNAAWLFAERIVTMVVNLGVFVWMARYLGPTEFGVLNYIMALVALFGFLSYLGIDSTLTRRLVEHEAERSVLLGTAWVLKLAGSIGALLCIAAYALISGTDGEKTILIAVVAIGILFQPATVIDFLFQAEMQGRLSATARTVAALAVAMVRVALIVAEAPLVAFAATVALQYLFTSMAYAFLYRRMSTDSARWTFDILWAVELLRVSWPMALAGGIGLIMLKIDQIMLGSMISDREVGIYAVAVRISEVWWFIPTALAATFLPVLVQSRNKSNILYGKRLQKMYDIMVWSGIAIALPISIIATPLVSYLYGTEYILAANMLQVHVWSCPAMFAGAILQRWCVLEGHERFSFYRNLFGAAANVGLNLLMIPKYGGFGAAIATLIAYTASSYLACMLYPAARTQFVAMSRTFLAPLKMVRGRW